MSKKTIIIAWRFTSANNNCQDTISFNNGYEIIKFYTPNDGDEPIRQDCFNQLTELLSKEDASDLYVFIHSPNFNSNDTNGKNMKDSLVAYANPKKNIYIEAFQGGNGFVYCSFIDQQNNTLKNITQESIENIFNDLELQYGRLAILESLIHLHKTASVALLESGNKQNGEYNTWLSSLNKKYTLGKDELSKETSPINNIDSLLSWASQKILEHTKSA